MDKAPVGGIGRTREAANSFLCILDFLLAFEEADLCDCLFKMPKETPISACCTWKYSDVK